MLQRDSMIKQFELITQHEIAAHNRAVAEATKCINEFRRDVDAIIFKSDKMVFDTSKKVAELEKSQVELNEKMDAVERLLQEQKKVLEEKVDSYSRIYLGIITENEKKACEKSVVEKFNFDLTRKNNELSKEIERLKNETRYNFGVVDTGIDAALNLLREELKHGPGGIDSVKKDVISNIQSVALDAEGVLRELRVYKKEVFVLEKKIEELYNKIDRINRADILPRLKPMGF